MKLVVMLIFIADTMNSVFDVEYTYNSLVNHYSLYLSFTLLAPV
jgi:hypothetical protein